MSQSNRHPALLATRSRELLRMAAAGHGRLGGSIDFADPLGQLRTPMSGAGNRRTLTRAMRRWAAMACVLALALVSAPLPRALRSACEICPADCPMHRHHGARADSTAEVERPKCHGAPASSRASAAPSGLKLTRPPCGSHALFSGMAMPPIILPPAPPEQIVFGDNAIEIVHLTARGRVADSPETPPPIFLA
jgi:hypothetical protein